VASQQSAELEESNRQIIGAWSRFAQGAPNGRVQKASGVTCAFSNVPLAFFNVAFLSGPVLNATDLNDRIATAKEYGAKSGFPWMFCACNEWLPEPARAPEDAFNRHDLHAVMPLIGMVTDVASITVRSSHSPLEYRRVANRETCIAASDINCAAYGIPLEVGRESFFEGMFGNEVFAYVGYLEGQPVTAAGVWIVDGIQYVAIVATHPDHRRKGYAESVMWHSLQEARKATGITRTVLHATEAGFPVYERMGYRSVARFTFYAEPHA
jgi:ribosomal protein S18 acetylase RimI-like enzyme